MHAALTAAFPGYDHGESGYKRITFALFAAGFATFLQVFDAQAALPAISTELGIAPSTAALTVSATTLGIAASVIPWAAASDRFGRVTVMRISLVAASVVALVVPFLPTFEAVVIGRIILGVALGAVPGISVAYMTEELVRSRVSIAAGLFVAGNTFGGICGRLIAGPLSELIGWRPALFTVAVIAALIGGAGCALLPRARGHIRGRAQAHPLHTRILFNLRDPYMLGLYAQGFLLMGAFAIVYNYLGFRLAASPFDVPATLVSLMFVAYLAGTIASRTSARLAVRFGHARIIGVGIAVMAIGAVMTTASDLVPVLGGLVIFTIGCFSAHPVASGLTGQAAQLGVAQATALYQLSWLGGTALFGWIGGTVFEEAGWPATVGFVVGLCGAAAGAALIGLTLMRSRRPAPPSR
ncbi:MFS transporter [Cryobacterium sp. AP23]